MRGLRFARARMSVRDSCRDALQDSCVTCCFSGLSSLELCVFVWNSYVSFVTFVFKVTFMSLGTPFGYAVTFASLLLELAFALPVTCVRIFVALPASLRAQAGIWSTTK